MMSDLNPPDSYCTDTCNARVPVVASRVDVHPASAPPVDAVMGVLEFPRTEERVLTAWAAWFDFHGAYPTLGEVADLLGLSLTRVHVVVRRLVDKGAMDTLGPGKTPFLITPTGRDWLHATCSPVQVYRPGGTRGRR